MPEGGAGGPATPLGILAGGGPLPRLIAEARARAGLPYLVVMLGEAVPDWAEAHPHAAHALEMPQRMVASMRRAGCTHVVMAGGIPRPRIRWSRFRPGALLLALRLLPLLRRGDNGLLSGLARALEAEGFRVIGVQDILGEILAPEGPLGRVVPSAEDLADARRAAAIIAALGPHDVGQGAVVARGICLAVEAIEGTDLMLERLAALPAGRRGARPSGVLVKMPKPGQDLRVDLPTIGPGTVARASAAGLNGIVVAAGAANVIGLEETRAAADAAGLFVAGLGEAELCAST